MRRRDEADSCRIGFNDVSRIAPERGCRRPGVCGVLKLAHTLHTPQLDLLPLRLVQVCVNKQVEVTPDPNENHMGN